MAGSEMLNTLHHVLLDMIRGFVGSPNRDGLTAAIVREALLGAEEQGAEAELVHLAEFTVGDVPDCNVVHADGVDSGPKDDFAHVSELVRTADAVVVGSPVYWSTITGCTRALLTRMLRVEMGTGPTWGMPSLGIVVAGGSGNGMVEAMKPMYLLFEKLRWRPLDSFPVTRFNWDRALAFAHGAGKDLAALADQRRPVPADEIWTFYNGLRYRNYDRIDERRLLAELIVNALPDVGAHAHVASELRVRMDKVRTLFDRHRKAESVRIIDDLIAEGTRVWETLYPSD
jgi:NAD(P)H-dependent FMN reductase